MILNEEIARQYKYECVESAMLMCFSASQDSGWWNDIKTGEDLRGKKDVPTHLMLIVSELGEAMEGHRKNKMDDHLPNRKSVEVELADAFIRICDLCGGMGYDLPGAVLDKLEYNAKRADHKPQNRLKDDGKKY